MAIAVTQPAVSNVEVLFPGSKNDVWYRSDKSGTEVHAGGTTDHVKVDIQSVS